MQGRPTLLLRRLRRGCRRGAGGEAGVVLLVAMALVAMVAWHRDQDTLRLAEIDRERGRIWAMTCSALHRAVQSGLVTTARTVTPAELRGWSLLPAGLGTVERAGGEIATPAYGTVLAGGVPMAACSLAGPELAFRTPSLRAGAVMGGLDLVGVVGGDDTAMHDGLAAVQAVLGSLPAGSMFATADFGIGHAADRLHRRPVGGRPELSQMETDFVFGPNTDIGQALLPAGEIVDGVAVVPAEDCRDPSLPEGRRCFDVRNAANVEGVDAGANGSSRFRGSRAEIEGNVAVGRTGQPGQLSFVNDNPASGFSAGGGFQFGDGSPGQAFNVPQMLSVGGAMSSRATVDAGSVDVRGRLDVGGRVRARGQATGQTLSVGGELGADSGSFGGAVTTGSCNGCEPVL